MTTFNTQVVYELRDKLTPQLEAMARQVDATNSKITAAAPAIKAMEAQMSASAKAIEGVKSQVKQLAVGFIGFQAVTKVFSVLKDFDTALLGIKANADGLTNDTFKALKDQAMDLGAATEFTATQVANGMVDLAKAGLKANEILAVTPAILDAATAAGSSFEVSSNLLVKTISTLGLKMEEIPRLADLTAKAANISTASFNDIAAAITTGGSAAFEFNIGLEETYGTLAILTDALSGPEKAGSSFSSMLRELGVFSTKGAEALAQYGLTYDDINPKTNKLVDIIEKLKPLLKDTNAAYALLGDEGKKGAVVLSANTDRLKANIKALEDSAGSAKKLAEMMRSGLKGSFDSMLSSLTNIIIQLGEAGLVTVLKLALDAVTMLARAIGFLVGLLSSDFVQAAVVGLVAYVTYMRLAALWTRRAAISQGLFAGALLFTELVTGKLKIGMIILNRLKAAGIALNTLLGLTNPFSAMAIAVGVLVGAVVLLWKNWDWVIAKLKQAWEWFSKLINIKDMFSGDGEMNINKTVNASSQNNLNASAKMDIAFLNQPAGMQAKVVDKQSNGFQFNTGISMSSQ